MSYTIVRYNDLYANAGEGLFVETHGATMTGRVNYNHIYNNTFFANGHGCTFRNATYPLEPPQSNYRTDPPSRSSIYCASDEPTFITAYYGNVVKNNLEWRGASSAFVTSHMFADGYDLLHCDGYDTCGDWKIFNNWLTADGDPSFTDEGDYSSPSIDSTDIEWYWQGTPDGSDITTINDEPDLTLQYGSPCIDSGKSLTFAIGAGSSSTKLCVDDPAYFQPGWGNGAGGGAVVYADVIAVGTTSNTVRISSVGYDSDTLNDTIYLDSEVSWSDSAEVWLIRNSSNEIVLYGSEPDLGSHETNYNTSINGMIGVTR
jgi:hypothetical protein